MSGNKFFKRQASSLDTRKEYRRRTKSIGHKDNKNYYESLAESIFNSADLLDESEIIIDKEDRVQERREEKDIQNQRGETYSSLKESKSEIRMQEIEELLLEKAIFRNIHGNICVWTDKHYKPLSLDTFTSLVRKLLPQDMLKRISRYGRFKEAYEYLQANTEIADCFTIEDITISKSMIVFDNGIYIAKSNKFIESTYRYPIMFKIHAKYMGNGDIQTPYMDSIINSATGNNQEILQLFYESLGYIFSQGIDAKKFFLLATAPDSGKSIIGEFLGKILGDENVSTIPLHELGGRFSLGTINTKVLNYNMDLPASELEKTAVQKLKTLTGDVRIECEQKYVQSKTSIHHCKFLFASNHPLRIKSDDEAFYQRLVLIPFIFSVKENFRDYDLLDKLWKERHAIATKAAMYCHHLYENNLVFTKSKIAEKMISEWRGSSKNDFLQEFFDENYCISTDDEEFIPTDIVFRQYIKYLSKKGIVLSESAKAQFSKKFLHTFGLAPAKKRYAGYDSPVNGYSNLQVKVSNQEGGLYECDNEV